MRRWRLCRRNTRRSLHRFGATRSVALVVWSALAVYVAASRSLRICSHLILSSRWPQFEIVDTKYYLFSFFFFSRVVLVDATLSIDRLHCLLRTGLLTSWKNSTNKSAAMISDAKNPYLNIFGKTITARQRWWSWKQSKLFLKNYFISNKTLFDENKTFIIEK